MQEIWWSISKFKFRIGEAPVTLLKLKMLERDIREKNGYQVRRKPLKKQLGKWVRNSVREEELIWKKQVGQELPWLQRKKGMACFGAQVQKQQTWEQEDEEAASFFVCAFLKTAWRERERESLGSQWLCEDWKVGWFGSSGSSSLSVFWILGMTFSLAT